jgi:uncharacterized protein
MDVTPLISSNQQVIQGYQKDTIKVSGKTYDKPVLVCAFETISLKLPQEIEQLTFEHLDPALTRTEDLDLILIGMSSEYLDKRDSLISLMNKSHLNFEIMELGAVCRTYNVLMAEGRRVAAILTQY